jgi:hypothetical protein
MLANKNERNHKFAEHATLIKTDLTGKFNDGATISNNEDSILIGDEGINTDNDTGPATSQKKIHPENIGIIQL